MDRLIVRDDVSGIADSCKKFADFSTVTENIDITAFMYFI